MCTSNKLNLGFLVDSSGSIEKSGKGNYQRILNFVKNLATRFPISKNLTNVGMAIFAEEPRLRFDFNKYNDAEQASDAINSSSYLGSGTLTGRALQFVRKNLFTGARQARANVLVVVTDGASQDYVSAPARQLRDMNVTIYVVAVGEDYDEKELQSIASGPNMTHILKVDFDKLEDLYTELRLKICQGNVMVLDRGLKAR